VYRFSAALSLLFALLASCSKSPLPAQEQTGTSQTAGVEQAATRAQVTPNDYSKPNTWLCLPGRDDYCNVDLTTTVITADGGMAMEPWAPSPDPKIDCFYVYPTVSRDRRGNSDMIPGPGEIGVVKAQFARFAEDCKLYAPLYRQVTLTGVRAARSGDQSMAGDPRLAYQDVASAWKYYLAHDNNGRGVVLIGHSQGASILTQLITNEIDGKPAQQKLVSAILLGTRLSVPAGSQVGGAFEHIPLCTAASQTGCVIAYASFRADLPPPDDALFGRAKDPGMVAACTNPAALGGGSGELHAYLSADGPGLGSETPEPWVPGKEVSTPFVSVPGMLTAECVDNQSGSYLAVTVHGDPSDPRVDDIVGDVVSGGKVQRSWGLHLIDIALAMGNLLDIVRTESKAWTNGAG